MSDNESPQSATTAKLATTAKPITTFKDHFNTFNDKMCIKDKIKNLCLLEQNNYFIDKPLDSLDHVDVIIRPIKRVPQNFRSLNKWSCQMNQKLNFVWQNINADFCEDFKKQLENFTSVDKAYGEATKKNSAHNPNYKSNKSTSICRKDRKKATTLSHGPSASATSISSDSSNSNKEQYQADFDENLNRYKDEGRLEKAQKVVELESLCNMTKLNLNKKKSENDGRLPSFPLEAGLGDINSRRKSKANLRAKIYYYTIF